MVNGLATFASATLNRTGSGYTLTAGSPGLAAATSAPFDVTAGKASRIAFVVQPTDIAEGTPFSPVVVVEVQDALGNRVTTATGTVTVSVRSASGGSAPSGTTLVGGGARALSQGAAVYTGMTVNVSVQRTLTLRATSTGFANVLEPDFRGEAVLGVRVDESMESACRPCTSLRAKGQVMTSAVKMIGGIALGLVVLSGCGGSGGDASCDPIAATLVSRIEVQPQTASMADGASLQLAARAFSCDGSQLAAARVQWSSADATTVSVSATGMALGLKLGGPVAVTAVAQGKQGSAQLTVVPRAVSTVTVEPATATVAAGRTSTLVVKAFDAQGRNCQDAPRRGAAPMPPSSRSRSRARSPV